jgi:general secretion pathway protein B
MSILLEALRKSEKNRRPHETPTIHTDDQLEASTETLRTMPLALLMSAALLMTGWMVWRQYQPPAESYQPPVTLQPGKVTEVPTPDVAEQPVGDADTQAPAVAAATPDRTPVESYQPPAESAQRLASGAPSSSGVEKAGATPSSVAENGGAPPTAADQAAGAPRSGFKPPASGTAGIPVEQPAEISQPVETVPQEFHPGEPAPIGYWELPDSVRAEVPEIKFSVLVYSTNPSDRFVLVNGQRLAEGDTAQPGLVVKEIRRDGVVFSFRLYQFLVEK